MTHRNQIHLDQPTGCTGGKHCLYRRAWRFVRLILSNGRINVLYMFPRMDREMYPIRDDRRDDEVVN